MNPNLIMGTIWAGFILSGIAKATIWMLAGNIENMVKGVIYAMVMFLFSWFFAREELYEFVNEIRSRLKK